MLEGLDNLDIYLLHVMQLFWKVSAKLQRMICQKCYLLLTAEQLLAGPSNECFISAVLMLPCCDCSGPGRAAPRTTAWPAPGPAPVKILHKWDQ